MTNYGMGSTALVNFPLNAKVVRHATKAFMVLLVGRVIVKCALLEDTVPTRVKGNVHFVPKGNTVLLVPQHAPIVQQERTPRSLGQVTI